MSNKHIAQGEKDTIKDTKSIDSTQGKTLNFYVVKDGKIITSPIMYAKFFEQENFIRIATHEDKLLIIKDTNNVIDYFNHNTNTVSYLMERVPKIHYEAVANHISKQANSDIIQGFKLLPDSPLTYYKDSMKTFGLPFKNGFFRFDDDFKIENIDYKDVNGFFAPHPIQQRTFTYTDAVGDFENFYTRATIGQKECSSAEQLETLRAFQTMLGYMCHSYKNVLENPCIILTDADADDETRNGRRGKTLITQAIQEVQSFMHKGGKDLKLEYNFSFDDLDIKHNVYIIDDVPAGFKYEDLYTCILGGINCQRKGRKAEFIPFADTPKFLITTNWVVYYNQKNASTNTRFLEYKLTNYYKENHSPKDEFNKAFFEGWDAPE
jgi:hypothetical protein